jgi:hypothetical protein
MRRHGTREVGPVDRQKKEFNFFLRFFRLSASYRVKEEFWTGSSDANRTPWRVKPWYGKAWPA